MGTALSGSVSNLTETQRAHERAAENDPARAAEHRQQAERHRIDAERATRAADVDSQTSSGPRRVADHQK
jgi:hypothetical protein